MPAGSSEKLAQAALEVLERNRREAWTCPSGGLYPHQWLWDSCFHAIGLSHDEPERAARELRALFRGQWTNGMLPHMIFAVGMRDVGSRRVWQSKRFPEAPRDVETSCITQPPLPAVTTWLVSRRLPERERTELLTELFPRLIDYHEWLYRERDPERRGLATLIHPWECGLDTTPPWMRSVRRMAAPWWLRVALVLRLGRIMRFVRRDTRHAPASQRVSDDDGLRILALAQRAKRHRFQLSRMPRHRSVLIEDLSFNSLLSVSNRALRDIANEIGTPIDPELEARFDSTDIALEELWDDETGQYYSRDAVRERLIKIPTVATFLPLWAGTAAPARARRVMELLREGSGFWSAFPVPSVPTDAAHFDEDRYWKGPSWVNTNWMTINGLRLYDDDHAAAQLTQRTLQMVDRAGFFEYFSPVTGAGYGAAEFSWTAALVVDLVRRETADRAPSSGTPAGR